MLVFGVLSFATAMGTKLYLKRLNRKLRRRTEETGEVLILILLEQVGVFLGTI
jgi:hypothetical protein